MDSSVMFAIIVVHRQPAVICPGWTSFAMYMACGQLPHNLNGDND